MKKALLMTVALAGGLALADVSYDVVIYGSSPAALTAAIEAQNHGKTAVIRSAFFMAVDYTIKRRGKRYPTVT